MNGPELQAAYEAALRESVRLQRENQALRQRYRDLAGETHHRIRDHLQLLVASTARRRSATDLPGAQRMADQLTAQIMATSRVYERLATGQGAFEQGAIEMSAYLRGLCDDLVQIGANPVVRLDVNATPLIVRADRAVTLGLIASELVTNSYKHAFRRRGSGNILVELASVNTQHSSLSVADTGDGFAENFVKGSGCTIVETLAESMAARVSYGSGPGAEVRVLFPVEGAASPA